MAERKEQDMPGERGFSRGPGKGRGMGRGRKAKRGSGGFCICPDCGYQEDHNPGDPCFEKKCPECGQALWRKSIGLVEKDQS